MIVLIIVLSNIAAFILGLVLGIIVAIIRNANGLSSDLPFEGKHDQYMDQARDYFDKHLGK